MEKIKWFVKENDWLFKNVPEEMRTVHMKMMEVGWGNGYALIPLGHPYHGVHYDDIDISVHGGLTYSSFVSSDQIAMFHLDSEDLGKWCVGFDTSHYEDSIERWPKFAVEAEAKNLSEQLEVYAENNR